VAENVEHPVQHLVVVNGERSGPRSDEPVPLSSGQRGRWLAEQAIPGSALNNLARAR
jgi:hypothetical protein